MNTFRSTFEFRSFEEASVFVSIYEPNHSSSAALRNALFQMPKLQRWLQGWRFSGQVAASVPGARSGSYRLYQFRAPTTTRKSRRYASAPSLRRAFSASGLQWCTGT